MKITLLTLYFLIISFFSVGISSLISNVRSLECRDAIGIIVISLASTKMRLPKSGTIALTSMRIQIIKSARYGTIVRIGMKSLRKIRKLVVVSEQQQRPTTTTTARDLLGIPGGGRSNHRSCLFYMSGKGRNLKSFYTEHITCNYGDLLYFNPRAFGAMVHMVAPENVLICIFTRTAYTYT